MRQGRGRAGYLEKRQRRRDEKALGGYKSRSQEGYKRNWDTWEVGWEGGDK